MIDSVETYAYVTTTVLVYFTIVYLFVMCIKQYDGPYGGPYGGSADYIPKPRPPDRKGMAGAYDPNYQTLANLQDPFAAPGGPPRAPFAPGAAPPQRPRPPAKGGMAGAYDPNYQTLANIRGDVFGADKREARRVGGKEDVSEPAAPLETEPGTEDMAGIYDPNYQTLAGMNADVFGEDKNAA